MRITKLHILLFLALITTGFCTLRGWNEKDRRIRELEQQVSLQQKSLDEFQAQKAANADAGPPAEAAALPAEGPSPLPPASTGQMTALPGTEPAPPMDPMPAGTTYTVQKGDTLWSIAKMRTHFGLGHRWYDIWKANADSVRDFDRIEAGQVLTIPLDTPEGHPWPLTADDRKKELQDTGEPDPVPVEDLN